MHWDTKEASKFVKLIKKHQNSLDIAVGFFKMKRVKYFTTVIDKIVKVILQIRVYLNSRVMVQ
jgi:hypothetical protein